MPFCLGDTNIQNASIGSIIHEKKLILQELIITKLTKHVKTSQRRVGGYTTVSPPESRPVGCFPKSANGFCKFWRFCDKKLTVMSPIVSIIMGSTSDLPVLEKAAQFFDEMEIPFEMNALSAHRTPQEVETFAREAQGRGIKVIIAAAGMAAALPGVIAANTTLPVIGVPVKGMLDGLDAMLSIIQMPPGIPVATVGVNGALNAAILAAEMLALGDAQIAAKVANYKDNLKNKITKANAELKEVQYKYKTN